MKGFVKKSALLMAVCCASVFAGGMDIKGIITSVDSAKKTITMNGNTLIQVLPQTQIKLDDCGVFGNDVMGKFTDLKVNSFAEAEVFLNSANIAGDYATSDAGKKGAPMYIAEEVEIQCTKNAAY